jgi:hypothetical protein
LDHGICRKFCVAPQFENYSGVGKKDFGKKGKKFQAVCVGYEVERAAMRFP